MAQLEDHGTTKAELHAADIGLLERRMVELALARTGAKSGAIFLWDADAEALVVDFHVVDTVVVALPNARVRRRAGRPRGIAMVVQTTGEPYLCPDTSVEPHDAPYFLPVKSIAAVPIPWQGRSIGVITVSSGQVAAFGPEDLEPLGELANSAAKFLRRDPRDDARERAVRPRARRIRGRDLRRGRRVRKGRQRHPVSRRGRRAVAFPAGQGAVGGGARGDRPPGGQQAAQVRRRAPGLRDVP